MSLDARTSCNEISVHVAFSHSLRYQPMTSCQRVTRQLEKNVICCTGPRIAFKRQNKLISLDLNWNQHRGKATIRNWRACMSPTLELFSYSDLSYFNHFKQPLNPIISNTTWITVSWQSWETFSLCQREHVVRQEMSNVSTSCLTMQRSSLSLASQRQPIAFENASEIRLEVTPTDLSIWPVIQKQSTYAYAYFWMAKINHIS